MSIYMEGNLVFLKRSEFHEPILARLTTEDLALYHRKEASILPYPINLKWLLRQDYMTEHPVNENLISVIHVRMGDLIVSIHISNKDEVDVYMARNKLPMQHVHELQNLYFLITKKQLHVNRL